MQGKQDAYVSTLQRLMRHGWHVSDRLIVLTMSENR